MQDLNNLNKLYNMLDILYLFLEQRLKSLDLSKHMITHMNRELTLEADDVEVINLDQNSISKLENISHLHNLQQVNRSL